MPTDPELPVRVGVYDSVEAAHSVVDRLLTAGFDDDHVTIVCSDEGKVRSLHKFEHQHPAGTYTSLTAAIGGAIGFCVAFASLKTLDAAIQLSAISLLDAAAFAGGIAAVIAVAALAVYYPARRATRIDPAVALRAD